jgi:hypothetical protein
VCQRNPSRPYRCNTQSTLNTGEGAPTSTLNVPLTSSDKVLQNRWSTIFAPYPSIVLDERTVADGGVRAEATGRLSALRAKSKRQRSRRPRRRRHISTKTSNQHHSTVTPKIAVTPRQSQAWKAFVNDQELAAATKANLEHRFKGEYDGVHLKLTQPLHRCEAVDVVYTWVNGSDPAHMAARRQWLAVKDATDVEAARASGELGKSATGSFRFRDWGSASTLKYSLRSVFKHAPWVNKIWIVTSGGEGQRKSFTLIEIN